MTGSQLVYNDYKKGFTLIELAVVIAIVGILSAVVYPIYSQYMYEVRRTDAWNALTAAAAAQERWYSVNHTYSTSVSDLVEVISPEGYYMLSMVADDSSFTITATARSNDVQDKDSGCTQMTIDHLGVQWPTSCWK